MKLNIAALALLILIGACKPDPEPPLTCGEESIHVVNENVYKGHITLCNAQGSQLISELGQCSLKIQNDSVILNVVSTTNGFDFEYTDTVSYECLIKENSYIDFGLIKYQDSSYMGTIMNNIDSTIFFILEYPSCINSSFFEGIL